MLDAIELPARAGIECDREAMELPAWFHDARLVLVTKTHKVSDDDVNGVSDEDFKPARARVLASLLDGPLFHATGRER